MKNKGYTTFFWGGGRGGEGEGAQISCIMGKLEVAHEYFLKVVSQPIKTKTFIDLKITRKSVKPVK